MSRTCKHFNKYTVTAPTKRPGECTSDEEPQTKVWACIFANLYAYIAYSRPAHLDLPCPHVSSTTRPRRKRTPVCSDNVLFVGLWYSCRALALCRYRGPLTRYTNTLAVGLFDSSTNITAAGLFVGSSVCVHVYACPSDIQPTQRLMRSDPHKSCRRLGGSK